MGTPGQVVFAGAGCVLNRPKQTPSASLPLEKRGRPAPDRWRMPGIIHAALQTFPGPESFFERIHDTRRLSLRSGGNIGVAGTGYGAGGPKTFSKPTQSFCFTFDALPCARHVPRPLIMRHTLSVLVENKFGVLTRIAGMFSGRGFNIDSLNVGPTLDPTISRMTIVVRGNDRTLDQVGKQLNKLVDVINIDDFRDDEVVERELVLLRVKVDASNRAEVMQLCDIFRAKAVDVQHEVLGIEVTGNESKIDKFLMLMGKFGISELSRTGRVALARKPN